MFGLTFSKRRDRLSFICTNMFEKHFFDIRVDARDKNMLANLTQKIERPSPSASFIFLKETGKREDKS